MISWSDVQANPALAMDYVNQQAGILNEQGGTGPSAGSPNLTMGQQYLAANPDVFQDATARATAEGIAPGQAFQTRVDEIAREHFDLFGRQEGRSGFGYTAPEPGTFAPSPTDGMPFTPGPGSSSGSMPGGNNQGGTMPGFQQPTPFDFDQYNNAFSTALGNFNGLLDSYNSFFGDMLNNANNPSNMQPQYGGGFLPFATTLMPLGGGYQTSYNPFNTTVRPFSGGWNAGSSWGGGSSPQGQAANSAHQQWFTF